MRKYALLTMLTVAGCLVTSLALAQPAPAAPALPVAGAGRQTFKTVEILADGKIVFKTSAPAAATDVKVNFAGKDHALAKGADGVWSVTVDAVPPQIYSYAFRISDVRTGPGELVVPAKTPAVYELQDVPHGTVTLVTYKAPAQPGRVRNLRVYLPPQYYSEPNRRFPVLYLFNGSDEMQWTTVGRANVMLDNLIAQGKAQPMIVVMPNNTIRDGIDSSANTVAVMEKELPDTVIPMIQKNYRTLTDRNSRAIAGLSFGGGTAFGVGMRNLHLFNYIGEFGTGTFGGLANPTDGYVSYLIPYDGEKIAPGLHANLTNPAIKPKLFYMSCGVDDPRLAFQKVAYEDFLKRGITPVFTSFPGGHDFEFFRAGLADFVPRLFKA